MTIALLCLPVLLTAASADAYQVERRAAASADSLFASAVSLYRAGQLDRADDLFSEAFARGDTPNASAAAYMRCLIAVDRADYDTAESRIGVFFGQFPESKYEPFVRLLRARMFYEREMTLFAFQELLEIAESHAGSPVFDTAVEKFAGIYSPGISAFVFDQFENRYPGSDAKGLIDLKRAQKAIDEGDFNAALDHLTDADRAAGKPVLKSIIQDLQSAVLNELNEKKYFAVLMPFSGEYMEQGIGIYRGLTYALDRSGGNLPVDVGLKAVDTRESANTVIRVMKEIADDRSIIGVIGPVDPMLQMIAVPLAKMYRIPMILPENFRDIVIEDNDYVFRLIGSAESEGEALAEIAVNELGCSRIAVLSPLIGKEERMASSFALEVERLGGNIIVHEWYYPGAIQFNRQLSHIRRTGYEMMMADSLQLFVRGTMFDSLQIARDSLTADYMDSVVTAYMDSLSFSLLDSINAVFEDSLRSKRLEAGIFELDSLEYPVTKYDALFIPVTDPIDLDYVVNQTAFYNIRCTLLGNAAWHDEQMLNRLRPSLRLKEVYFTSDYYLDDFYDPWADFRNEFRTETGLTPGLDEIYGFDSMQFALRGLEGGNRTRGRFLQGLRAVDRLYSSPRNEVIFDDLMQKSNWMIMRYAREMLELYSDTAGNGGK